MEYLKVIDVCKSFGKQSVLEKINMIVNKNEIVSILGPSGEGKSTLLRCINQLEKIDDGDIFICGNSLKEGYQNKEIENQNIKNVGLVFQEYNLFSNLSVLENVMFPLMTSKKIDKQEAENKVNELLKKLNIYKRKDDYPCNLSGGEKQRTAIARTLIVAPKVICFDEPTSALDGKLVKGVIEIIKELAQNDKAILIVTHDVDFANKVSDRIIKLSK